MTLDRCDASPLSTDTRACLSSPLVSGSIGAEFLIEEK